MKITFLGTGTSVGVPMLLSDEPVNFSDDVKDKRMRSSALIEWAGASYLIDCGADFRMQMLQNKVQHIDGILFTHEHSDHVGGLDDIRPYCYKIGQMPIYAMERVMQSLEKRYEYIFATENRYAGAASIKEHIVGEEPFLLKDKTVVPIKVDHGGLPILGYRIDKIGYITDAKFLASTEIEKLKGVEALVVNALRIQEHPTHFNLEEALDFVKKVNPKKAYFTHISHRLGFHEEVQAKLPENVYLAYDGLEVEV